MPKIGIIGATGYAGAELVRLLLSHPHAEIAAISSVSFEGKGLEEVYPAFRGLTSLVCENADAALEKSEVVFACLPHGHSQPLAAACEKAGKIFIDLGADFRLGHEEDYKQWYGESFDDPALHQKSVYALPELFREEIKGKTILANPGCYPTSAALGVYPALKRGLVEPDSIIIDAKSGVTGAGRSPSQNTHFPDCNEAFSPYKIAAHRHTPEIEQTLSRAAGKRLRVTFVPHLLPLNRGIVSTIYAKLRLGADLPKLRDAYETFYENEPFVRLLPDGDTANLKNVRYTNFCDISLHADRRTGMLIAVSAIDNMIKGAAGQAIQNMNLACGLPEDAGLRLIPPSF